MTGAPRLIRVLTARQGRIVYFVGMGYTYTQIGAMLDGRPSVRTVKREVDVIDAAIFWPDADRLGLRTPRQRVHAWYHRDPFPLRGRAG